jgi:Uma2 family endonuclease
MVQAPHKPLTLEEFLALPEIKPANQYLNGQIIQKPMPQGKHSVIQGELVSTLNRYLKPQQIARAFPELRCTFGDRSTVPDIAVFTWERIPRDADGTIGDRFNTPPDWILEILSPEQSQTKVTKNILHSLKHGTQMGWLIDPHEQTVLVYQPQRELEICDDPEAQLPTPGFAHGLGLTVRELFAWLLE